MTIEVQGDTADDLVTALDEVSGLVTGGYLSGRDCNESGRYSFSVTGEEVGLDEEDEAGDDNDGNDDGDDVDDSDDDGQHVSGPGY